MAQIWVQRRLVMPSELSPLEACLVKGNAGDAITRVINTRSCLQNKPLVEFEKKLKITVLTCVELKR